MLRIPQISDNEIRGLRKQIRFVLQNSDRQLCYIQEEHLDPRRSAITRDVRFCEPAEDLVWLEGITIETALLVYGKAEATIAEVLAQLIRPQLPESKRSQSQLGQIKALEILPEPAAIDIQNNRMLVHVYIYGKNGK